MPVVHPENRELHLPCSVPPCGIGPHFLSEPEAHLTCQPNYADPRYYDPLKLPKVHLGFVRSPLSAPGTLYRSGLGLVGLGGSWWSWGRPLMGDPQASWSSRLPLSPLMSLRMTATTSDSAPAFRFAVSSIEK